MAVHAKTSKTGFKKLCDFHVYTGGGNKHNVLYYDRTSKGNKFAVALDGEQGTKADLIKHAYNWICNDIALPYFVRYKYAIKDEDRFKVPLALNF